MTTVDIIKELILKHDIKTLRLVDFDKSKYVQENPLIGKDAMKVVDEALSLKKELDIPFWDAVNISNSRTKHWSSELIELADHHNVSKYSEIAAEKISEDFSPDSNIGINSRVKLSSGETKHIPMIDFHINHTASSLEIVKSVSKQLNQSNGYIIDSGASYHYIGASLMNEEDFMSFLAHSLLYGPIVDNRWVAHQLIERSATLRIGKKHDLMPRLIADL